MIPNPDEGNETDLPGVLCQLVTALLATTFGFASFSVAADHQMITSVAAIYEYNDNIQLNAQDPLSDSIYTVAPKIELVREAERLSARADGMAEFYRYQEYDQFSNIDQWYNASVDYLPAERWQLTAEGHVSEDNRPDRDIETTGLVLNSIRRRRINAGASASYAFSEITSGGLYGEFNRENFDDPKISDHKDYHALLFMTRSLERWLDRTTGRLNVGYDHYEFEREYSLVNPAYVISDQTQVENYSLTVGTETDLSERLNWAVNIGGRYARSKADQKLIPGPILIDDTYDTYGFVGNVTIKYHAQRSTVSLFLSNDLQPVSGKNTTANRTIVRLSGYMRLLEKLVGNLGFQWYRNENDQNDPTQQSIDTRTWNAYGGLQWDLTKHFALKGHYGYTIYDDRIAHTTAYRNRVLVQLIGQHDWLE